MPSAVVVSRAEPPAAGFGGPTTDEVHFTVNHEPVVVRSGAVDLATPLVEFLRQVLNKTGTKTGCNVGGCGACTVVVSSLCPRTGNAMHRSVNACLTPVLSLHGCNVTTTEGLGSVEQPHPIQERIAKLHGSQCGFCTPGMVMSLYALLLEDDNPTPAAVEKCIDGNLCRCTGYRPILDAAKTFTTDLEDVPLPPPPTAGVAASTHRPAAEQPQWVVSNTDAKRRAYGGPVAAARGPAPDVPTVERKKCRVVRGAREGSLWLQPATLADVTRLLREHRKVEICSSVVSFYRVLTQRKAPHGGATTVLWCGDVPEMHTCCIDPAAGLRIGSGVAFTDVIELLRSPATARDVPGVQAWLELASMMEAMSFVQYRNGTDLGGHLMSNPPGELYPLLACVEARVVLRLPDDTERAMTVRELQQRRWTIGPFVIVELVLPPQPAGRVTFENTGHMRRDGDHAHTALAVSLDIPEGDLTLTPAAVRMVCTGPDRAALHLDAAAECLVGVPLATAAGGALRQAQRLVGAQFRNVRHPNIDGRNGFRLTIARGFLYRFMARLRGLRLGAQALDDTERSALGVNNTVSGMAPPVTGVQEWETPKGGLLRGDLAPRDGAVPVSAALPAAQAPRTQRSPVGDPKMILSGLQQATGEATYIDDMPVTPNSLHGAFVKSTIPHGRVVSVDPSAALRLPGVERYVDHRDMPNKARPAPLDDLPFAGDTVRCIGDVIGIVLAADQVTADRAALLVRVTYEALPHHITMEEALAAQSLASTGLVAPGPDEYHAIMGTGDVDAAMGTAPLTLSGTMRQGAQEHFYMEPHTIAVVPMDLGDFEVFSPTQNPTLAQAEVAKALNIPRSKVAVRVKRVGGGFGGKEFKACFFAATVAVAAHAAKRPVRMRLTRDDDMQLTGWRHPWLGDWKVAFDETGRIHAVDMVVAMNAGKAITSTAFTLRRGMFHSANAYSFPNFRVNGCLTVTNVQAGTAFRGFGSPNGIMFMEVIMEAVAAKVRKPLVDIQRMHFIKPGEPTFYKQTIERVQLHDQYEYILKRGDFHRRLGQCVEFNKGSRWVKKGVHAMPMLYGINFDDPFLNQGYAMVCMYGDGSASVHHGGVELGQGLNTKVAQVAAQALGIPIDSIFVGDTHTDKIPFAPPTAASMTTDLSCQAVLKACEELTERLGALRKTMPKDATMAQVCWQAILKQVPLSAIGHYGQKTGGGINGEEMNYYTTGCAVTEVELDVLTGLWRVMAAHIVVDVGQSINTALDVGQIEGGFVQGMGLWTMEDIFIGDKTFRPTVAEGKQVHTNPHQYKIPLMSDTPVLFDVALWSGNPNPRAVHGSRAIGEPPLCLGTSVYFALKNAIASARADAHATGGETNGACGTGGGAELQLDTPLTAKRIRMACGDEFTAELPADPTLSKI